jgi:SAM-dependent methyltransferase
VTAVRLGTETIACPSCGARDATRLFDAPSQLVDLDQEFTFARCRSCDLVYLATRVGREEIPAFYDADYPLHRGPALWGPFAPFVARDAEQLDARRVALVRGARELAPADVAIDVGCGRPTFLARLRRETGCRAVGVDAVDVALDDETREVELHVATPPDWPEEVERASPFSLVTMWHALEHDPSPVETLRWLGERTRPDGVAVVEVPDYEGATARWLGRRWPGLHTPRHASVFTPATLRATAERAGWRVASHARTGTLSPFVLVALGLLDAAGFRFGRHPAAAVFPLWALAMGLTWPWLRPSRPGLGLQTVILSNSRG